MREFAPSSLSAPNANKWWFVLKIVAIREMLENIYWLNEIHCNKSVWNFNLFLNVLEIVYSSICIQEKMANLYFVFFCVYGCIFCLFVCLFRFHFGSFAEKWAREKRILTHCVCNLYAFGQRKRDVRNVLFYLNNESVKLMSGSWNDFPMFLFDFSGPVVHNSLINT